MGSPKGQLIGKNIGDCVVRAISLASGLDYDVVEDKLYYTAQLLDCPERCVCCYSFLLDNVLCYEPIECEGMFVGEFADTYNEGIFLVRMDGHITCVIDGEIYDTCARRN